LELLIDWCRTTGLSLVQLLPMNDVGFNFRPYDAESSFALEPMYLSLEKLLFVPVHQFSKEIIALRKKFPVDVPYFDRAIKHEKLALLVKIFEARDPKGEKVFRKFIRGNHFWLPSYAQFKVLKETMDQKCWQDWPAEFRERRPDALQRLESDKKARIEFHYWLQWQLFEQFCKVRLYAKKNHVFFIGDLPFLVSRDSADVWARQNYFKLSFSAGAPPDYYFADGQEWGMPPYDWSQIESGGYDYLVEKLKYAENFYDFFRIDHFVGIFRIWTFPRQAAPDGTRKGFFDPPAETEWEAHGRKILSAMVQHTDMMPCAEDLGTIPVCSPVMLEEFAIPGMEIQRWTREWKTTGEFKNPEDYRKNSIATISTHDMTSFVGWWMSEATPEDKEKFWRFLKQKGSYPKVVSTAFAKSALEASSATASIFCVQLLEDWLALKTDFCKFHPERRINVPGSVDEKNWRVRLPLSLEEMIKLPSNKTILSINRRAERTT
jgi:4-alpha-glucanotransferase